MRVRNIIFFIFLCGLTIASCTSSSKLSTVKEQQEKNTFEGIVKYKFLMESVSTLTDDQIDEKIELSAPLFGRHMTYYVKQPKLKTVMDGEFMKLVSYNDDTDSMYMYNPELD